MREKEVATGEGHPDIDPPSYYEATGQTPTLPSSPSSPTPSSSRGSVGPIEKLKKSAQ